MSFGIKGPQAVTYQLCAKRILSEAFGRTSHLRFKMLELFFGGGRGGGHDDSLALPPVRPGWGEGIGWVLVTSRALAQSS